MGDWLPSKDDFLPAGEPEVVERGAQAWSEMASVLHSVDEAICAGLRSAQAVWTGPSAESFSSAWAEMSKVIVTMADQMEETGRALDDSTAACHLANATYITEVAIFAPVAQRAIATILVMNTFGLLFGTAELIAFEAVVQMLDELKGLVVSLAAGAIEAAFVGAVTVICSSVGAPEADAVAAPAAGAAGAAIDVTGMAVKQSISWSARLAVAAYQAFVGAMIELAITMTKELGIRTIALGDPTASWTAEDAGGIAIETGISLLPIGFAAGPVLDGIASTTLNSTTKLVLSEGIELGTELAQNLGTQLSVTALQNDGDVSSVFSPESIAAMGVNLAAGYAGSQAGNRIVGGDAGPATVAFDPGSGIPTTPHSTSGDSASHSAAPDPNKGGSSTPSGIVGDSAGHSPAADPNEGGSSTPSGIVGDSAGHSPAADPDQGGSSALQSVGDGSGTTTATPDPTGSPVGDGTTTRDLDAPPLGAPLRPAALPAVDTFLAESSRLLRRRSPELKAIDAALTDYHVALTGPFRGRVTALTKLQQRIDAWRLAHAGSRRTATVDQLAELVRHEQARLARIDGGDVYEVAAQVREERDGMGADDPSHPMHAEFEAMMKRLRERAGAEVPTRLCDQIWTADHPRPTGGGSAAATEAFEAYMAFHRARDLAYTTHTDKDLMGIWDSKPGAQGEVACATAARGYREVLRSLGFDDVKVVRMEEKYFVTNKLEVDRFIDPNVTGNIENDPDGPRFYFTEHWVVEVVVDGRKQYFCPTSGIGPIGDTKALVGRPVGRLAPVGDGRSGGLYRLP